MADDDDDQNKFFFNKIEIFNLDDNFEEKNKRIDMIRSCNVVHLNENLDVSDFEFCPNGNVVILASDGFWVMSGFNHDTLRKIHLDVQIDKNQVFYSCISWAFDYNFVVLSGKDLPMTILNVSDGIEIVQYKNHDNFIVNGKFSQHFLLLVTCSNNLSFWVPSNYPN